MNIWDTSCHSLLNTLKKTMRIISPILVEVLLGLLILVCAEETTVEPIQPYEFGFNDGLSTRQEQQTADGVVKGSYSYIDAYGEVQKVSYSADAVNGYVVHTEKDDKKIAIPTAATTIGKEFLTKTYNEGPKKPVEISKIEVVDGHIVDTPEVAAAKARHFKAFREAELVAAEDAKKEQQKPEVRRTPAIFQPKIVPQKTLVKTLDSSHQNAIPQVKFSGGSSYVEKHKTLDSVHQNAIPQVRFTQELQQLQDNSIYTPEVAAAREEHFKALRAAEELAKDNDYIEPTTVATPIVVEYNKPTTVPAPIVVSDNGVYTPEVQAAREEHFRAVQQAEQQQLQQQSQQSAYVQPEQQPSAYVHQQLQQQQNAFVQQPEQQQQFYANPTVPSYVPQSPNYYVAPTPTAYTNYVQPTSGYVQPTSGYSAPTNMYFTPNSAYGLAARVNQYENVPQGQQTYQNYVPQGYQNAYTPLTIFYK